MKWFLRWTNWKLEWLFLRLQRAETWAKLGKKSGRFIERSKTKKIKKLFMISPDSKRKFPRKPSARSLKRLSKSSFWRDRLFIDRLDLLERQKLIIIIIIILIFMLTSSIFPHMSSDNDDDSYHLHNNWW